MKKVIHFAMQVAATFACWTAIAQVSQPPNASNQADAGLQEIVVTALRTETDAQRTPIALTIYSAEQLRDAGVTNIAELTAIDPSVNFTAASGAGYVAMRGIASTDLTEIGDPSVPISRDGFFTNRSYSIESSMYDVNRVEVLKGPQGTLQGRNSTGGLISIVTNRPTMENGGYVTAELGSYDTHDGEFAANWVANDLVQFRFSGIYRKHDGYRQLEPVGGHGDDEGMDSVRLQTQFEPFAGFKGWLSYQRDDTNDVADVFDVGTGGIGVRPAFGDAKLFTNYSPTLNKLLENRLRWEFSYDLPADLGIFYSGGYDRAHWRHTLDGTAPTAFLNPFGGSPGYPAITTFVQAEEPETWNHELRIATQGNGPFQFQGGFFYFRENNELQSGLLDLAMAAPFAPGGPLAGLSQTGVEGINFAYKVSTRSEAAFGQMSYAFNEQWKISAGARYTEDKKIRTGQAMLFLPALASPFAPPITIVTPGNGNTKDTRPTYHLGVDYQPTAANLLYAKFDTGYKAGGFNSNGSAPAVAYGPESVKTYEVGSKNRFWENRIELNAAVFHSDYRGYQASQEAPALNGAAGVFNVGSAKIYGGELQGVATGLFGRADLNLALLNTRFGEGITVVDGSGVTQNIGGHELPNAPKYAGSIGYQYDFLVGGGALTPRIDGKYSAPFYYSVFNDYDTESLVSFIGNVSLTYAPNTARWELQAFVRNFTDRVVLLNATRSYVSYQNEYELQAPRVFGVRGTLKF